jgi:ComF family protein
MNPFKNLIDVIYPPRCPICGAFFKEDIYGDKNFAHAFCPVCIADFQPITSPLCKTCGTPFGSQEDDDHLCEDCIRKRPYFKSARAPYLYEGAIMTAIHRFKYVPKGLLADSLGPILAEFAHNWLKRSKQFLTIPVPLHPKRLRERGFNHSLLLARHVAAKLTTQLDFLALRRVRYTAPQTGLKRKERQKNVRRAFQVRAPEVVKGREILLVDDVATTGSTLNECARALKMAGSGEIMCVVLARTGSF